VPVPVTSLQDEVLLAAATATGTTLSVMRRTRSRRYAVRQATAAGDLAHGLVDGAALAGLPDLGRVMPFEGLLLAAGMPLPGRILATLRSSSDRERATRRRSAARTGVEVDAAAWQLVAEHARRFLVPEVEA
jgi:hypothetical protein